MVRLGFANSPAEGSFRVFPFPGVGASLARGMTGTDSMQTQFYPQLKITETLKVFPPAWLFSRFLEGMGMESFKRLAKPPKGWNSRNRHLGSHG